MLYSTVSSVETAMRIRQKVDSYLRRLVWLMLTISVDQSSSWLPNTFVTTSLAPEVEKASGMKILPFLVHFLIYLCRARSTVRIHLLLKR
jgi:hypothetical protein